MWVLTTVTSFAFVITAAAGAGDSEDEDSGPKTPVWPKKPYSNLLTFKENDYNEAFKSLDLNNDDKINTDDLKKLYFHKDSEFAVQKFIKLLDTQKTPGSIDQEEFTKFMQKDHVKRKIHEDSTYPTLELRKKFYADDILSYVYLVMDQNVMEVLFDSIESPDRKNGKLDFNEIQEMQMKLMNGDTKYKLSEHETKLVLAEISGAGSEVVSKEDFKEYFLDGILGILLRECRKKTTGAEYDNACLIRKLIRYTTKHLTEYKMTLMFVALDTNKKDKVSVKDVQDVFRCDEEDATRFVFYVGGQNGEFSYADFRSMARVPAIKTVLETKCMSDSVDPDDNDLEHLVHCLNGRYWDLSVDNFFPKYIGVPDLDIIFIFEDLDNSNDGTIEQKEDLEKRRGYSSGLAKKFMDEMGPPENNGKIHLDDFFHYIYEPYMMCAIAECQVIQDNKEKLDCYINELTDVISYVLDKGEVVAFFGLYEDIEINFATLKALKMPEEVINNYLLELGHGNEYVNHNEFKLFVKQQEPSHLFSIDEDIIPKKHLAPAQLHEKLLWYIEHYMTENDIATLFSALDVNHNNVIDSEDIEKVDEIDAEVVGRMALYGNKEHATLQEFWMFINTKAPGSQETRKHILEQGCAQTDQAQQTKCFMGKLKSLQ